MSFIASRSAIDICNKALGRVGNARIAGSLDNPTTPAAQHCALLYPTVVRTLLEQHHFGLATRRATLIATTNDRESEWVGAYVAPNDMAFPVSILPYPAGQVAYYKALGALLGMISGRPVFRYENNRLYTMLADVQLEYVSLDITEADFNQTFENLVIVFLASELANVIPKDRALAKDLYEEGMTKLNQAIAQNLNMQQPTYGNMPTETEVARGGASIVTTHLGLPY